MTAIDASRTTPSSYSNQKFIEVKIMNRKQAFKVMNRTFPLKDARKPSLQQQQTRKKKIGKVLHQGKSIALKAKFCTVDHQRSKGRC